ncbi:MAG: anti-sigma factor [Nocardioidaceae bacterium]
MTDLDPRSGPRQDDAEIEIIVPAGGEYLSVLRTAAAGLAARLDFTLDDIEDLRIAVDEACAMLLSQARPGSRMTCAFRLGEQAVTFRASVHSAKPTPPSKTGFAWTVLSALATAVDARVEEPDVLTIELTRRRPSVSSM